MNSSLSEKQLHLLQHSLGVDRHGRGHRYRNHFVTGPGSDDFAGCLGLVSAGLMRDGGPQSSMRGDHLFQVTDLGVNAMLAQSPPPAKLSRGKLRYRAWLRADCGLKFGEWLKRQGKTGARSLPG